MSGSYSTFLGRADELVALLHDFCIRGGVTLSTAESVTGGLISSLIVSHAGASRFFKGGAVTYSNESKESILGVDHSTLLSRGAVSAETALEMAAGAMRIFGSSAALSTTGIAGPSGATAEKEVGLVFIAACTPSGASVSRFIFQGGREDIRQAATLEALRILVPGRQGGASHQLFKE